MKYILSLIIVCTMTIVVVQAQLPGGYSQPVVGQLYVHPSLDANFFKPEEKQKIQSMLQRFASANYNMNIYVNYKDCDLYYMDGAKRDKMFGPPVPVANENACLWLDASSTAYPKGLVMVFLPGYVGVAIAVDKHVIVLNNIKYTNGALDKFSTYSDMVYANLKYVLNGMIEKRGEFFIGSREIDGAGITVEKINEVLPAFLATDKLDPRTIGVPHKIPDIKDVSYATTSETLNEIKEAQKELMIKYCTPLEYKEYHPYWGNTEIDKNPMPIQNGGIRITQSFFGHVVDSKQAGSIVFTDGFSGVKVESSTMPFDLCPNQTVMVEPYDCEQIQKKVAGHTGEEHPSLVAIEELKVLLDAKKGDRPSGTECEDCGGNIATCATLADHFVCVEAKKGTMAGKDIEELKKIKGTFQKKTIQAGGVKMEVINAPLVIPNSGAFFEGPLSNPYLDFVQPKYLNDPMLIATAVNSFTSIPLITFTEPSPCNELQKPFNDKNEMRLLKVGTSHQNDPEKSVTCYFAKFHPQFFDITIERLPARYKNGVNDSLLSSWMPDMKYQFREDVYGQIGYGADYVLPTTKNRLDFFDGWTAGVRPESVDGLTTDLVTAEVIGAMWDITFKAEIAEGWYKSGRGSADGNKFFKAPAMVVGVGQGVMEEYHKFIDLIDLVSLTGQLREVYKNWKSSSETTEARAEGNEVKEEMGGMDTKAEKEGNFLLDLFYDNERVNSEDKCIRDHELGKGTTSIIAGVIFPGSKMLSLATKKLKNWAKEATRATISKQARDLAKQAMKAANWPKDAVKKFNDAFTMANIKQFPIVVTKNLNDLMAQAQDRMQGMLNNAKFYEYFKTIKPDDYRYFAEDIIFALDNDLDLSKAIDANPRMVQGWGALKDIPGNPLSTTLRRDPDALKRLADDLSSPELKEFLKSDPDGLESWNVLDKADPSVKFYPCK